MDNTKINAATEALLTRLEQDLHSMAGEDLCYLQAGKNLLDQVRTYREIKKENPVGAATLKKNGYLGTPLKWLLNNEVVYMELETIKLLWRGVDISKNASKHYNDPSLGLNKSSKLAVCEHIYPTQLLKEEIFETAPIDSVTNLLRFILNHAVISWTAAIEDTKLREGGWNTATPDSNNIWARYEAVDIKTFPLRPEFISSNGHDLKISTLLKAAKKVKKEGLTFEKFKQLITY